MDLKKRLTIAQELVAGGRNLIERGKRKLQNDEAFAALHAFNNAIGLLNFGLHELGQAELTLARDDRWHFLCGTYGTDAEGATHWSSITAACQEDGIGVVASWSRVDGDWVLTSWGCTEDHSGDDQEADEPIPDTPPASLLTREVS